MIKFEMPEIEVEIFNVEDVITASGDLSQGENDTDWA